MALAPELAGLAAFVACLILLGTYFAYTNTIGALTSVLASLFLAVSIPVPFSSSIHPLKFIADGLTAIDNGIKAALLAGIEGTKWAYTTLFHSTAYAVQEIGAAIHGLAADTENALGILTRHKIAALIAAALIDPLSLIGIGAASLVKLEHRLGSLETTLRRDIASAEQTAVRAEASVAHAIAVDLPAIRRKALGDAEALTRPIGREVGALGKSVSGLASKVTPGVLTGVVAFALTKFGFSWLRCSNVNRVGKGLCGVDRNLLESVLLDATAIAGAFSLVEFAKELQDVVVDISDATHLFYGATK